MYCTSMSDSFRFRYPELSEMTIGVDFLFISLRDLICVDLSILHPCDFPAYL